MNAKVSTCELGLALLTIPYFLLCIFLLPWRMQRVRLGNIVGAAIGRWVFAVVGLSYELRGSSVDLLAPALYVQNHTGTLDLFLAMQLCPRPCSGTLKKEFLRVPFIGLGYLLSGHLLIDRENRDRAIRSMNAISALVQSEGLSIWMLPEGARSPTGRLLPIVSTTGWLQENIEQHIAEVETVINRALSVHQQGQSA
jgi:lysophosphatidate acyltransferase